MTQTTYTSKIRITGGTIIVVMMAVSALVIAPASPARAHYIFDCARVLHDSTDIKGMVKLNHSPVELKGYMHAQSQYSWCTNNSAIGGDNVQQMRMLLYGQYKTTSGSFNTCTSRDSSWLGPSAGWGEDWWTMVASDYQLLHYTYCGWDYGNTVRGRVVVQAEFVDGHIIESVTVGGEHAGI